MGLAIAVAIRSFDPSLFTQLILSGHLNPWFYPIRRGANQATFPTNLVKIPATELAISHFSQIFSFGHNLQSTWWGLFNRCTLAFIFGFNECYVFSRRKDSVPNTRR